MAILASVLALVALAQAPQTVDTKLFGDTVSLQAPTPGATDYPDAIKTWSGWGPLAGSGATFPKPFMVDGDWSAAVAAASASKPVDLAPYRVKVILVPAVDLVYKTPQGNLDERRTSINGPCKAKIEQALLLAAAEFETQNPTLGHVLYDTSVDNALYEETLTDNYSSETDAVQAYVRSRINGGSFEANDKLFHGPYQLCLVIHAGLTPVAFSTESGTPVGAIPASFADESITSCAVRILRAFTFGAEVRSRRPAGYTGASGGSHFLQTSPPPAFTLGTIPEVFGTETQDQIESSVGFAPVTGEAYLKNLGAGEYREHAAPDRHEIAYAHMSPNAEVSLGTDPVKGAYLSVKLGGLFPSGGFVLPNPKDLGGNHYLVFDFRSNSHVSVGIGNVDRGTGISLGDRSDPGDLVQGVVDGSWHKIAIEVSKLRSGMPNTPNVITKDGLPIPPFSGGLYIGFLQGAKVRPRASMISGTYDFANFSLSADKPADAAPISESKGPGWDNAATAARAAVKAATTPENLIAVGDLLTKSDEPIRLNALDTLSSFKIPGIEEKLAAEVGNINPRITEAAIAALAFQGTATSDALLRKTLSIGPGTHAKAVAATYVAQKKDPASTGPISAVSAGAKDWHDRVLAAQALGACGVPQAWLFLYSSLADDDPGVREIAANLIDPTDDTGMHRLMFVSVNDASDAVRADSCIKLLQSLTPEVKHEGYRGVSDDSWWVKVQVLNWIAKHPSADDRPALLQGVAATYPEVRTAALEALATSPLPVTVDEVSSVLHDQMPSVQLGLIALAKAKGIVLPADVLASLKASTIPQVAEAAKTLANN